MYDNIQAKIIALTGTLDHCGRSKCQNSCVFFENRHVAYQIKENDIYTNIQVIILYFYTPLTHGVDQKVKTFLSESSHVAYQVKGSEMYENMQAHIVPRRVGFKGQNFLSESSHIAYQMNRKIGHAHTVFIYTKGGLGSGGGFL